jgi:hypothetical protein
MKKTSFTIIFIFILNTLSVFGQLKPLEGKVEMFNGRPTIFINGQPETPMIYSLTHAYGGRWSWEEVPARNLKNFGELGFRLYQVDLYFEDIWLKDKKELDIAKAQRQVRGVLDANPNAAVIVRVHVNAPFWWNEQNKEECTQFADGPLVDRDFGAPYNNEDGDIDLSLRASLASRKWKKEASEKLVEFCKRLSETPEGNAVAGIHISGGIYGEWHYWGFIDHDPDTSKPMTEQFRDWLKAKYKTDKALQAAWKTEKYSFSNATVPDKKERDYTAEDIFRNPETEQRVIDYFRCQQEVVADDIVNFCKIVKENWPRPVITGVFYGYLHFTFSRQAVGGHLEIDKIMNSPYIDYLSAPQSYMGETRGLGGSGHSRGVIEACLFHKKLWLDEMDNGEFKPGMDDIRINRQENKNYTPLLRRGALHPLSKGAGLWYYDFGLRNSFGWWDVPAYMKNIKQEKQFFDKYLKENQLKSESDVLFVWDMNSFYYMKNKWTPITDDIVDLANEEAYHAGFVLDNAYLLDLNKLNLDQYKLIVFMNPFTISEADKKIIKSKVSQNGRHVLWNYLSGYSNGSKNDLKYVEDLSGFKLKKVAYSEKPSVAVSMEGLEKITYEFRGKVNPLAVITDPQAKKLGSIMSTNYTVVGRKTFPSFTSWMFTLPWHDARLIREIARKAGAHIYTEDVKDVLYSGSGLMWIHTVEGGKKNIILKSGKAVELQLEPKSTTLYNSVTGVKVF